MKNDVLICSGAHEHSVDKVRGAMPDDDVLCDLAELYKSFADSTRVRILYALSLTEMCVCDLAELCRVSQSAVSHQLAILRSGKLVRARRDGKTVYYSLSDDHVRTILAQGIEHTEE